MRNVNLLVIARYTICLTALLSCTHAAPVYAADAFTSQNDGASSLAAFSSFRFDVTVQTKGLRWRGLYVSSNLADNPPPPVTSSFTIAALDDNAGVPGALVFTETYPVGVGVGKVRETFKENSEFLLDFVTPTTASIYEYDLLYPAPITVPGNQTYWLAIIANTTNPVGTPNWSWASGGVANGPTFHGAGPDFLSLTRVSDLGRDFSAIPEPETYLLFLFGALALMPYARHRRRAQSRQLAS